MDPRYHRLLELIHAFASETKLELLPERALAAAMEISRAERGFLVLVNGSIEVSASRNLDGDEIREAREKISRTILDRVMAGDRPVVLRDGELTSASARSQGVRAVCALPLRTRGRSIGAMYLDHRFEPGLFVPEEIDCLAAIGAQAAIAIEEARLREALAQKGLQPLRRDRPTKLLGSSPAMQNVRNLVTRFAPLPYPVLLQGESGTGKELVARALHPPGRPFVAANVAAIPESLFESEMFGHARGAFTGAQSGRLGLFQQASGGTLFLDEINSLSLRLQEKLLRSLEEGEVRAVGSAQPARVDVRLIAASNQDLERIEFRKDLYHRLNVLRIDLPPLRQRREDLSALVDHFLAAVPGRRRVSAAALRKLERHSWPGNVRELENAIRRAAALSEAETLGPEAFDFLTNPPPGSLLSVQDYLRETIRCYGSSMPVQELAAQLGISRKTLWHLRRRFGFISGRS